MYPEFRYFLEAYCTLGLDVEEVWKVIEEFKKHENKKVQKALQAEMQNILNSGNLTTAREMIEEYGYREFSAEETEKWLNHIVKKLQKEGA
ncbi:contact-dependent growth inhibition system immunity protein [Bacillus sp. OTU530]|uniref:contact-dependent growth inhibition system immunity protein n=1 Tax=Bacillus sp. OTU530 TaxID=3043862 RepID=UPI00313D1E03